jgi:hypothetical protein
MWNERDEFPVNKNIISKLNATKARSLERGIMMAFISLMYSGSD